MRRSREETAETRAKIVEVAARLLRERGIASVSVADIMGSLGLTVGGFYRHFESKEALVAEAIEAASLEMTRRQARMPALPGSRERVSLLLGEYLSTRHRDNPGQGCPVAALCSEISHEAGSVREAFTQALSRLVEVVESALAEDRQDRRQVVLQTTASLVGALVLARASGDEMLASEILCAAREGLSAKAG